MVNPQTWRRQTGAKPTLDHTGSRVRFGFARNCDVARGATRLAPADLALHMTDTLKCDRIAQKARAVYFFTPSTACLFLTAWLCPNPRHRRQSLHPSITVALEMRAPSFVIERREPKLTNWKSVNPFQSSQISPPHVTHSVGSVFGRCAYKANSVPHIDRARR